jgi:hypothetical protein
MLSDWINDLAKATWRWTEKKIDTHLPKSHSGILDRYSRGKSH